MTRGQNRPNAHVKFVYIVFPLNSFENLINFAAFTGSEILEDQRPVQVLLQLDKD